MKKPHCTCYLQALTIGRFATTIYVLGSGVLKLMRTARLPAGMLLYRGSSGGRLPASFYKPDARGVRGFAEWGFLSTTACRDIAVQARRGGGGGVRVGANSGVREGRDPQRNGTEQGMWRMRKGRAGSCGP